MNRRTLIQIILSMALLLLLAANLIQAQQPDVADSQIQGGASTIGPAFTYQGQLIFNDAPVNDLCDFTFSLWDETGIGSPPTGGNQVGSDVTINDVTINDGLFTVSLDFGNEAFTGDARWLEIEVDCGEGATTLAPRQALTPAPYALYAPPHNTLVAADGDPVDAVYVDNDGKTGVGTTNPGETLTVAGTIESTSGGFKFPDGTTQTTAAGDVKQLIQDLVVASGENVTAGDVVGFLDGYVLKSTSGVGPEQMFHSHSTSDISAATLSSTQFVIAYTDDTNSYYGTAVIGDVSGTTITYGTEYVFNSANTFRISVSKLSSTRFVVAYRDSGSFNNGTAVIGDVSGTTITYGSEYVFNSASSTNISAAVLTDAKIVVVYQDVGNSNNGTAVIGDVSGTTITFGSEYVFNSDTTYYLSVSALSDAKFVVAYRDETNAKSGTAVIGDVSGTTITYGSEYVFNSDDTSNISAVALSDGKFVVAYRDEGNLNFGTAVVGDVSDTTITYDSEHVFNSTSTLQISASTLSDGRFVVAYQDAGDSYYGTVRIGEVSITTITFGSEYVFNSAGTEYISVSALSDAKFVVAYQDGGNIDYGTGVIGSASGNPVGIARESKTEGQVVPVIITGVSDVHSDLIMGEVYFDDLVGGITTSESNRRIGLAISDTELLLDIDIY